MSPVRRRLLELAVVALLHELAVRALATTDLVERALSPSAELVVALPAITLVFALRFYLLFVAPGRLLAALLVMRRQGIETVPPGTSLP